MNLRAAKLTIGICLLLLFSASLTLADSTIILRSTSPKSAPELGPVQTYNGGIDPVAILAKPSPSVTAVILTDTMSPEQIEIAKKGLLAIYGSLRGNPMRLAVLRNDGLAMAGPFKSRAQLTAALGEVMSSSDSPSSPQPSPSAKILDNLNASASQLGGDWSRVLLIGDLPPLQDSSGEYACALLLRAFGNSHIRLSWFTSSEPKGYWLPLFQATGGEIRNSSPSDFTEWATSSAPSYFQVNWSLPSTNVGFVLSHSAVKDLQSQNLLEIPEISAPSSATLPSIEAYISLRAKAEEASQLLAQDSLSDDRVQAIRDDLRASLEINPRDKQALLTAATFFEKTKDYAAAARQRSALIEVYPLEAANYSSFGHDLVLAADFDAAEGPLQRAISMNFRTPQMTEDLARIRLAHKDDKAALPFLGEALGADPKRQDLWFIRAQAEDRSKDAPGAIHSFEQGLALGGVHIEEVAALAKLYIAGNQRSKASELVRRNISALPPDPNVRSELAAGLDDLRMSAEALEAWRRVLEVEANSGRAHLRVAQLLLESGDSKAAEDAANIGLTSLPKFAPLYLVKADALERAGHLYLARKVLEDGAASVQDVSLLVRLAATEDTYGGMAAAGYERLVQALQGASPEKSNAIERGFAVSVRDADSKHSQTFGTMLGLSNNTKTGSSARDEQAQQGSLIPGGLDALAFSAHSKEGLPPGKFLIEYCRTVIDRVPEQPTPESKRYVESILEHFQRIGALQNLGKREGDRTVITLSMSGKEASRRTEKVLSLLGIKLRVSNGSVDVGRGEKKAEAKKQETVSALAIDEVGLQDALRSNKSYSLEINDEPVLVFPNEKLWRDAFYSKENEPAGIVSAFLRLPRMARLYVGMSYLDRKTSSELISAINLNTLEQRYADLIYRYASAFAIQNGHAVVPGGQKAEGAWSGIVGASPDRPGPFFRTLLERNDGKLLAFFFTLSQIDRVHQEFFTANGSRLSKFFSAFAEYSDSRIAKSTVARDNPLAEVLRSVPLDSKGNVDFPGSAEVWTIAKGKSSGSSQVAQMMKKVSNAVAPELEDEILLRLAQIRYKDSFSHRTELENFLAVSRIDAHRAKPLDEQSALLLAQNYSSYSPAYPYFAEITELGYSDYLQFFSAIDRIKTHPVIDTNVELGALHSLVEWICILHNRRAIDGAAAAKLFKHVCDRFSTADTPSAYAIASMESTRTILDWCLPVEKNISPDDKIKSCFLRPGTNPQDKRTIEFYRTLDSQKAPSLEAVFTIYDGLVKLKAHPELNPDAIKKAAESLPTVELQKGAKAEGKEKEIVIHYEPALLQRSVTELVQKLSNRKQNPKDFEKMSQQILGELQPQVTLALAGKVYAYFLRPSDLVVSEDPLLLRKHQYLNLDSAFDKEKVVLESAFDPSNKSIGSHFVGGFAQFAPAAGKAAAVGWKTGGPAGQEFVAAQIAAIRSAAWDQLEESDQRLVSLRITIAREWIYMAALHPEVFRNLGDATMGLLPQSRRADLLNGIEVKDWEAVWESVTLPDLFLLGGSYLERFKVDLWTSPVTQAFRSITAKNDGARLNILGSVPYHSFGCSHPHMVVAAPYEEYEMQMFPDELAERSAEFKLFLAFQADKLGVEPSILSDVVEHLASKAFRNTQMMNFKDWRALQTGFGTIQPKDIEQALLQ